MKMYCFDPRPVEGPKSKHKDQLRCENEGRLIQICAPRLVVLSSGFTPIMWSLAFISSLCRYCQNVHKENKIIIDSFYFCVFTSVFTFLWLFAKSS